MKGRLLIIAIIFPALLSAQVSAKFSLLRPKGELGKTMKATVAGDILWMESFDGGETRTRVAITYASFQPRLDTFPVIATENDKPVAGTQIFHSYRQLMLAGGIDYAPFSTDKIYPYVGASGIAGTVITHYETNYPGISSEDFTGNLLMVGIRLRAGIEYAVSDAFGIFLEASGDGFLLQDIGLVSYNQYGLGIRITFN